MEQSKEVNRTADELYDSTIGLGQRCYRRNTINLMEEYASQQCEALKEENEKLKEELRQSALLYQNVVNTCAEMKEENDLLKKANDGLRTQMNLEAFRNRDLTRIKDELLKVQQRHNASTKAYQQLQE
jgi:hypothetical protein